MPRGYVRWMTLERFERYLALLRRIKEQFEQGEEVQIEQIYLLLDVEDLPAGPRAALMKRLRYDRAITSSTRLPIRYSIRHERIDQALLELPIKLAWKREQEHRFSSASK